MQYLPYITLKANFMDFQISLYTKTLFYIFTFTTITQTLMFNCLFSTVVIIELYTVDTIF